MKFTLAVLFAVMFALMSIASGIRIAEGNLWGVAFCLLGGAMGYAGVWLNGRDK